MLQVVPSLESVRREFDATESRMERLERSLGALTGRVDRLERPTTSEAAESAEAKQLQDQILQLTAEKDKITKERDEAVKTAQEAIEKLRQFLETETAVAASAEQAETHAAPRIARHRPGGIRIRKLGAPREGQSMLDNLWRIWFLEAVPDRLKEQISCDPDLYHLLWSDAQDAAMVLEEDFAREGDVREVWRKTITDRLRHLT